MNNLIILLLASIPFILSGCKAQDPEVKAVKDIEQQYLFHEATEALANYKFVLEADRVNINSGRTISVFSATNFVSMDGEKAVVQLSFNTHHAGPNGMGGITVEGNASNIKMKTDNKGNVSFSMDVTGIVMSARVDIDLRAGSNICSATVTPNFHNGRVSFTGYLYSKENSSVFKGSTM